MYNSVVRRTLRYLLERALDMRLPQRFLDEIIAHAREGRAQDAEICGVLLGKDGDPTELVRVRNVDPSPRVRYYMDPQGLFTVMQRIEQGGLDLVAIYHSHPHTRAYPSETDRRNAHDDQGNPLYPGTIYIICSLEHPEQPAVRAFHLFPDRSEEERIDIVDN